MCMEHRQHLAAASLPHYKTLQILTYEMNCMRKMSGSLKVTPKLMILAAYAALEQGQGLHRACAAP